MRHMQILALKEVVHPDNSRALLALLDVFDRAESTGDIKHKPTDVNPNFTFKRNTPVVVNVGIAGLPSCGSADCLLSGVPVDALGAEFEVRPTEGGSANIKTYFTTKEERAFDFTIEPASEAMK